MSAASAEHFTVELAIDMRPCRADDLPSLEWMGLFAGDRAILEGAFLAQQEDRALFLLAVAGGFPVAQIIVDLPSPPADEAYFWAVRTFFPLHGLGIGRRMMARAEALAIGRGARRGALRLERHDPSARRFYEKLGWEVTGEAEGSLVMTKRFPERDF